MPKILCQECVEVAKTVLQERIFWKGRGYRSAQASCQKRVGVDPIVECAAEQLLDMVRELALRCLERFRKRIEQPEKEGSPSF